MTVDIHSEFAQHLGTALEKGDEEQAVQSTRALLEAEIEPLSIINTVIIPALTRVGDKFETGEVFLPELLYAGKAAERATELLQEALVASGDSSRQHKATVLIGTVQGDVHDIGKNIVCTLLRTQGYNVVDLGRDVTPDTFLQEAARHQPSVIGLSSLMTTTMPAQKWTIDLFEEMGVRDRYRFVVGGGSVTQAWADEIGADGYASDAGKAIRLIHTLVQTS